MSRAAAGETVVVKPANNLFTWLAFVAVALQVIALGLVYLRIRGME
jgi:hypothetical protein